MHKIIFTYALAMVVVGALAAGLYFVFKKPAAEPAPGLSIELVQNIEAAAGEVEGQFAASSDLSRHDEPKYGFSFAYPSTYRVGGFSEESGDTLLLQNENGVGLQLLITPFDENITLTAERIRRDIPDLDMRNVETVQIGGVLGVSFTSSGNDFGESAEAWFVRDSHLYQFSTYAGLKPLLDGVVTNFQFN